MISLDGLVEEANGPSRIDLKRWIANDWVRPHLASGALVFEEIDVARIDLIRDLKEDLGINEDALPVVLMLLDQLYDLRRQIHDRFGTSL